MEVSGYRESFDVFQDPDGFVESTRLAPPARAPASPIRPEGVQVISKGRRGEAANQAAVGPPDPR